MSVFPNPEIWIFMVVAVVVALGLLARNKTVEALGGVAFCAAALYVQRDQVVALADSIHMCTTDASWDCIPLALGKAMLVLIFIGVGIFEIVRLIALLWTARRPPHISN
jgi:Na+/H+ antiporter NhaD/arsenite permease-like protein